MADTELAYQRKARLRGKNRKVRIEQVYDMPNLLRADKEARKGKTSMNKYHKGVRLFDKNKQKLLEALQRSLMERTYHTSEGHECERLCPCGKKRRLHKLPYHPDHIEHHALMQVIEPTMKKYYYYDSSASVKGKGMNFARKRTEKYISKNRDAGLLYFAKIDFVKFYHNIDQQRCYDRLAATFGNSGIRYLIWEVLTACEEGLGIGLYPIQPIANFYTSKLCRMVMAECDVMVEIYCDDIVILSRKKSEVWKSVNIILDYARNEMRQEVHSNIGVQVIDETHSLDFVGYQFFINRTLLRKRMKGKFMRKMHNLKDEMTRYKSATSYKGWLMHCDGLRLWQRVMKMNTYKDLNIPSFERVDADGRRMLGGTKVSAAMIAEREVVFRDAEVGIKSKYGKKDAAVIQVEDNGQMFKFFTCNHALIQTMQYCIENGLFPFKGKLHRQNPNGGMPDYVIE